MPIVAVLLGKRARMKPQENPNGNLMAAPVIGNRGKGASRALRLSPSGDGYLAVLIQFYLSK